MYQLKLCIPKRNFDVGDNYQDDELVILSENERENEDAGDDGNGITILSENEHEEHDSLHGDGIDDEFGARNHVNSEAVDAIDQGLGDEEMTFKDAEDKTFVANNPSFTHRCLVDHPDPLVESASLASATMPPLQQLLRIPSATLLEGRLTSAQLDSIARACAQHELLLPNRARKGFFLGDGAGVGKGRQQAAVIFHNTNHGRCLALWLSVSADLIDDARRDLRDIGAGRIACHDLRKYPASKDLRQVPALHKGVIFCTYALLVSEGRLEQLLGLLGSGFDGVLALDEIHRAKNLGLEETSRGKPVKGSQTAQRVQELQERLPSARVLYVSATGATEVEHMACFSRLGLWGPETSFPNRCATGSRPTELYRHGGRRSV